ncbi:MAG: flagellar protein FlaG [Anaerobacillus sp.]|uniref:flagellar protein FlaG n=1 Tax=Anaerobacillus sp. TaxID=1872506 RepID=UPI0039196EC6
MEIGRNLPTNTYQQAKTNVTMEKALVSEPIKQSTFPEQSGVIKKEDVEKKLESINKFLTSTNSSLKFTLHEELNEYYVAIVDEQTKEVIKEIPPKKLLDMFAAMKETIGIFIDKKI